MFINQSKLCLQDKGLLFPQTRKPWPGTWRLPRVPISKGAVSLTQALRLQTHVPRFCLKCCCEVGVRGAGSAGPLQPPLGCERPRGQRRAWLHPGKRHSSPGGVRDLPTSPPSSALRGALEPCSWLIKIEHNEPPPGMAADLVPYINTSICAKAWLQDSPSGRLCLPGRMRRPRSPSELKATPRSGDSRGPTGHALSSTQGQDGSVLPRAKLSPRRPQVPRPRAAPVRGTQPPPTTAATTQAPLRRPQMRRERQFRHNRFPHTY